MDVRTLGLKSLDFSMNTERSNTGSDWWLDFGDAQLNTLVSTALRISPSLKVTQARLTQALSASAAVKAVDAPQINGALDL